MLAGGGERGERGPKGVLMRGRGLPVGGEKGCGVAGRPCSRRERGLEVVGWDSFLGARVEVEREASGGGAICSLAELPHQQYHEWCSLHFQNTNCSTNRLGIYDASNENRGSYNENVHKHQFASMLRGRCR